MADDTKLVTSEVLNHFYGNLKKNYLLDEMSNEEVDTMMGLVLVDLKSASKETQRTYQYKGEITSLISYGDGAYGIPSSNNKIINNAIAGDTYYINTPSFTVSENDQSYNGTYTVEPGYYKLAESGKAIVFDVSSMTGNGTAPLSDKVSFEGDTFNVKDTDTMELYDLPMELWENYNYAGEYTKELSTDSRGNTLYKIGYIKSNDWTNWRKNSISVGEIFYHPGYIRYYNYEDETPLVNIIPRGYYRVKNIYEYGSDYIRMYDYKNQTIGEDVEYLGRSIKVNSNTGQDMTITDIPAVEYKDYTPEIGENVLYGIYTKDELEIVSWGDTIKGAKISCSSSAIGGLIYIYESNITKDDVNFTIPKGYYRIISASNNSVTIWKGSDVGNNVVYVGESFLI